MSLAYHCDTNGCEKRQVVPPTRTEVPPGWTNVQVTEQGASKSQSVVKIYHLCPSCSSRAKSGLSGGAELPP